MDSSPSRSARPYGEDIWISSWMRGIRANPRPSLLMELPSTRIVELSGSAAELLGITRHDGARLTDVVFQEVGPALAPTDLLAANVLATVQGSYRFTPAEGDPFDAWYWIRAVRSPAGPDLALMGIQVSVDADVPAGVANAPVVQTLSETAYLVPPLAKLALDASWRVEEVMIDLPRWRSSTSIPRGAFVIDLVDPQHRTDVLCALALATNGVRVVLPVRMLSGEGAPGHTASAVISLKTGPDGPRFLMQLYPIEDLTCPGQAARTADLERRLYRIAAEVQGATLFTIPESRPDVAGIPALSGLSERQVEIVGRLLQGQRVPEIAKEMFLSKSTVRNHLSNVFRKFGVHNQAGLISAVRARQA